MSEHSCFLQLCNQLSCPLQFSYSSALGNHPAAEFQQDPGCKASHHILLLQEVMRLGPTMYFGELALLRGEPRAATVAALTDASVLMLAREDFNMLLGPLQMLLGQNAALYGPTEATAGVKQVTAQTNHGIPQKKWLLSGN